MSEKTKEELAREWVKDNIVFGVIEGDKVKKKIYQPPTEESEKTEK